MTSSDSHGWDLSEKSDTFKVSPSLCLQLQREYDKIKRRIRSDHDREFENSMFTEFYQAEWILHEFSTPLTPQQNGTVERKNQTL